jgi:osmotically inducible protein OsmC
MAIKRTASALWEGAGKTGKGTLTTASGVLKNTPYSFSSRFEDGIGTNPEELIGAAHAGCFSMKLAFVLNAGGFTATSINTSATVILDNGVITRIELVTRVACPGLDHDTFLNFANDAKQNCPVSKLFNAEITLDAALV